MILSLLISIVIIKPVLLIKNFDFDLSNETNKGDLVYQETFFNYITSNKIDSYRNACEKLLEQNGIKNSQIIFDYYVIDDVEISIKNINVNLKNSVISTDKEHIDIVEMIKTLFSQVFYIEKGDIIVYGKWRKNIF